MYIDDRHNSQLQVDLTRGSYSQLQTADERNLAAANSAILGFLSDSVQQAFHLIPAKKEKFLNIAHQTLACKTISVETLQRLMGKCVFFSLAVPGALLFTREMNLAISKGMRTHRLVKIDNNLHEEITHWLFLETWDDPSLGKMSITYRSLLPRMCQGPVGVPP